MCQAARWRFNQSVNERAQTKRGKNCTQPVEPSLRGIRTLWHVPERNNNDENRDRDVYEKDSSPRNGFDQPSSEHRTNRGSNGAKTGPGPDCPATVFLGKRITNDCQAAWNQQRRADPLHSAGCDQLSDVGGETAPSGGGCENRNTNDENSTAPVTISHRTADK